MTIAGKHDKTNKNYPKELAIGVFNTLGVGEGEKLNKEQFIQGYENDSLSFLPSLMNIALFRCKKDPDLRELFGGGH